MLNNDLRHPAVLAQDLASIDVLSGGRLDVAIGAGWNKPEYDAIGLPFDPTPVRQARLAESITVLKGCSRGAPFSFAGEHYTITDYAAEPVPVQRPHPPFFIGGGGRRTLDAGRARGGHRRPRAAHPRRRDRRRAFADPGRDPGEDRLGARGGRRRFADAGVQHLSRPSGRRRSPTICTARRAG